MCELQEFLMDEWDMDFADTIEAIEAQKAREGEW